MLANISHDIKTPLTVILGYLEILRLGNADDEMLKKVESKAKQVMDLINQFFTLAKLEAGDTNINLCKININEICRENVLSFYDILLQKDFTVDISIPETTLFVQGDKDALQRMGAVTRVVSMGSLMVFGFIKGFQPIAGYSYGAKKFDRLHEAIKTSIIWSTIFCVIYGLVLTIFSKGIISQFTKGDLEMIRVGTQSLRINGISFMLFGFYTVYSSLFLALGKGLAGFILGACRQGICFVPVILILPAFWGINGILYVQPIADLLSAIITIFMALHLHKELTLTKQKFLSEKTE